MATVVQLANSRDTWGGLTDGYRRTQLGQPTGTVGQPPSFKGVSLAPSQDVKAPKIMASAARNNAGTNVCIPYARICPASELADKGRLDQGDVAFLHRKLYSSQTGKLKHNTAYKNAWQERGTYSCQTPHAHVHNLAGLDWVNRMLGPDHFAGGQTVLINSTDALHEWRSLSFIAEWCVDGVVLSNDTPGYVLSSGPGSRNDQLFNIAIQGVAQVNNGFEDDQGHGLSAQSVRHHTTNDHPECGSEFSICQLIGGPFYNNYPLQMFDRKIKPLSECYIGLVCTKIDDKAQLDSIKRARGKSLLGTSGVESTDNIQHIHVFQYKLFSDRQVWNISPEKIEPGTSADTTDVNYAEPADRRRGPLKADGTFNGITRDEISGMVGAWRIGKVLDTASQRKQGYTRGPVDTAFRLTVNVDISFLDWRALRRRLICSSVGKLFTDESSPWTFEVHLDESRECFFTNDDKVMMHWPTKYPGTPTMYPEDDKSLGSSSTTSPNAKRRKCSNSGKVAIKAGIGVLGNDIFSSIIGGGSGVSSTSNKATCASSTPSVSGALAQN